METKRTPPPRPPKNPDFVPAPPQVETPEGAVRPKFTAANQLWKLAKGGRRAIISDATELWQKAVNYFEWCDGNPLTKGELVKHQGDAEEFAVTLGRPYSMDALTIYAGVSASYFRTRKGELGDKAELNTATPAELDLLDTIALIENVVRNQRFEGAAVGLFKENLISRVDGYADNINQHNTGEVRQTVVVRDQKTSDDLAKLDKML